MPLTERQHAMLEAMGVPVWRPPAHAPASLAGGAEGAVAAVAAEVPPRSLPHDAAPARPPRPVAESAPTPRAAPSPAPALATRAAAAPARPAAQPVAARSGLAADAIAAMDWPALREAVAACQSCGLCGSRSRTVFGVGHEQARWMIVGEAPGEQEDREGEPFVGKAGQLLDQMLKAVGLTRDAAPPERQVFIANVLKCRPPSNRNPLPEEVAQCEPFLRRQVALVRPTLILAMGRFAVQSLLGTTEPIGRLRGRVHAYEGVPVVVTYHPAYLLRTPQDKARSWEDLCLAREVLGQAAGVAG